MRFIIDLFTEIMLLPATIVKEFHRVISKTYITNKKSEAERLRYFKPTVHVGLWSTTTTWEERDEPLSMEEVEKRYK